MSTPVEIKAEFVKLQEYHRPALADGDYEITVTQKAEIDKPVDPVTQRAGGVDTADFTTTRFFTVAGERFELKPTDVESVFPPDGNLGDHFNVLPHIILNRSTLPWERTVNDAAGKSGIPWLALLLFDEDQKPEPKTITAADLKPQAGGPHFPAIKLEMAQQPEDPLTVIDVKKSLLETLLPPADELKLATHVRFGTTANDQVVGDELAIIIANRLPQKGKSSTAHLVSVEKRFKQVAGNPARYEFDYGTDKPDDLIRLVSLKSWTFACESHDKSFKQLFMRLNSTPSTLRLPAGTSSAEKLFSYGYVVVPHYFREGDETVSWFRGPLIPGKNMSRERHTATLPPQEMDLPAKMPLPARTADELARYYPELAMFDVSYAAAWELGRLLALQDKDFSSSLYQWKRQQAQRLARDAQRLLYSDVPYQSATRFFVPEDISAWFKRLRRLEGVPFNYLVPDERMLPVESIRFFRLDHAWVDCLADGAFSVGRVTTSDHATDGSHGSRSPAAGLQPMVTGFLLRSEVVSGWPGLHVDGFSDHTEDHLLNTLRMERLSSGVLLCLFAGEVERVDFYLKPETLHFGFHQNDKGGFSKKLRDAKTGKELETTADLGETSWHSASQRTINITKFAESIKETLKLPSPLTSAQFGLQMIEGGEKIVFRISKS